MAKRDPLKAIADHLAKGKKVTVEKVTTSSTQLTMTSGRSKVPCAPTRFLEVELNQGIPQCQNVRLVIPLPDVASKIGPSK